MLRGAAWEHRRPAGVFFTLTPPLLSPYTGRRDASAPGGDFPVGRGVCGSSRREAFGVRQPSAALGRVAGGWG